MKRTGRIIRQIASEDNLRLAFWKAARGKRARPATVAFASRLDGELAAMGRQLLSGEFRFGDYRRFMVYDPKERVIHAAAFRERVAHHALMNVCEPVLDRAAIHHSYACRVGKGREAAVAYAAACARRFPWFLKMDVRKYFDSIPHATLLRLLRGKFKDPVVLRHFEAIISSYATTPGRGLPIGALSSQHFANFFLGPLDRHSTETLRAGAYCRYMDDFVLWGGDKAALRGWRDSVQDFAHKQLGLEIKETPQINRTAHGMDFLGARLLPNTVRLARRSVRRFRRKLGALERLCQAGEITEAELQRRSTCLLAFARSAESTALRRTMGFWDLGDGQTAPTACYAAAPGATTRTTHDAPTATTTRPATRTTTTGSGLPELDLHQSDSRPEDDPAAVQSGAGSAPAKTQAPAGASSPPADAERANAPAGAASFLDQ
jgi:retron-type reverse transcriptase